MKNKLLLIFALLSFALPAQINVLTFKDSTNFKEQSIILSTKKNTLCQTVDYNEKGTVDEEYSYTLNLKFNDPTAAKAKKTINLAGDTALVKSSYFVSSAWGERDEQNQISGQIEIISWTKKAVTLKENITINVARSKKVVTFVGTRTFQYKKGW